MDALILTCGTGGGHNAAAFALAQELERGGHNAAVLNPYALNSAKREKLIDNAYISLVQNAPKLFGFIYRLGDIYRHFPWRSPVYLLNRKAADNLKAHLDSSGCDIIITTHPFPAEIVTNMRNHNIPAPPILFVATDYTCIPFVEETECDGYVIPHESLTDEFAGRGISRDKLYPLGIPVKAEFTGNISKTRARTLLGIDENRRLLVVSGGSIGAGPLEKVIALLLKHIDSGYRIAVICGDNDKLYERLKKRFGMSVRLLHKTPHMELWVKACDFFLTKPGGLSSTEAAVAGVPLIHLPPIPGCETKNAEFFSSRGMSVTMADRKDDVQAVLAMMNDTLFWNGVVAKQHECIPSDAASQICKLAEKLVKGDGYTQS